VLLDAQIARRVEMGRAPTPAVKERDLASAAVIEVLVEIIHGPVVRLDALDVAARLVARGVAVPSAQVEAVFRRYGLEKKNGAVSLSALAALRHEVAVLHAVGQRHVRSTGGILVSVESAARPCPVSTR